MKRLVLLFLIICYFLSTSYAFTMDLQTEYKKAVNWISSQKKNYRNTDFKKSLQKINAENRTEPIHIPAPGEPFCNFYITNGQKTGFDTHFFIVKER